MTCFEAKVKYVGRGAAVPEVAALGLHEEKER